METHADVQVVADLIPIESYFGATESLRTSNVEADGWGSTSIGSTLEDVSKVDGMVQSSVMLELVEDAMFKYASVFAQVQFYETFAAR